MRLSEQEIFGIIVGIETYLGSKSCELRLYGSRTNDARKGGDIDLLLISPDTASKNQLKEIKHKVLAKIKENIGDQKIDLLICEKNDIENDPFVGLIFPESVILKKW